MNRQHATAYQPYTKLPRKVILASIILLAILTFVTWHIVQRGQKEVIEHQAAKLAEVVANLATNARSTYAKNVVEKLRKDGFGADIHSADRHGYVPIPAQFLKLLGKRASAEENGLYRYRPVSKWNLEPTQGLTDDFLAWAWPQLEMQDQSSPSGRIDWQPIWRIETVKNIPTMRFLRADPASGDSCVNCHNQLEKTDEIIARRKAQGLQGIKQWKRHQLLGAIEVDVPLDSVEKLANTERNVATYTVAGVAIFGLFGIGLFVWSDIKRNREVTRELSWHAQYDNLTGLLNRYSFEIRLKELFLHSKHWPEEHALLFLDLDQFKLVNDTAGHTAGDALLQEIAQIMQQNLRSADVLARLGGDEFGILLSNCRLDEARQVAEKLRSSIKAHSFDWQGKMFSIGASIGMVVVNEQSKDAASLMSAVDIACYAAKDNGRNQIYVITEVQKEYQDLRSQMEWPLRIQAAIDSDQLKLAVQTAMAINSAPYKNYHELLLRMFDGDELIPTGNLIKSAERYNFMDVIDKWVIKKAFEYIHSGKLTADSDNIVAINLSGSTLNSPDIEKYILDLMETFPQVPRSSVCFEITETAAIYNLNNVNLLIDNLKATGCLFSLDDFGSGLSSLNYLKNLKVDFLKIDGSFIRDITTDRIDKAMVASIIQISHALEIPTIGEWVENEEILNLITEMGVTYGQGFYLHKPTIILT